MSKKNMGWICSRCQKSNAPSVKSCDCVPIDYYITYPNSYVWPYTSPIIYPSYPIVLEPIVYGPTVDEPINSFEYTI